MINKIFLLLILVSLFGIAQEIKTPLEDSGFKKLSSYNDLTAFVTRLPMISPLVKIEVIGKTKEGRSLFAVKISDKEFGIDKKKIKVLLFAQQHGNEPSGKEGALLLIKELLKKEYRPLLKNVDIVIVPQVNPDGAEKNQRRNSNGTDLNRNHLLLNQPETIALHKLFNKYLFEVTMDIHEYSPYGEEWEKYGYRRNFDEQIGVLTNKNIPAGIKELQLNSAYPFIKDYIEKKGFSAFHYLLGGPPEGDFIRHSTFDINDGRQSFGILNTFSFIQEGLNEPDYTITKIEHRAKGQMTGMLALLEYASVNKEKIKQLIEAERKKNLETMQYCSVQMKHVKSGEKLQWPLWSYFSGKDSVITVEDYRPVVKGIMDVKIPKGYLIPKSIPELKEWLENHNIAFNEYKYKTGDAVEQYNITGFDSVDYEGDIIGIPRYEIKKIVEAKVLADKYYYVPVTNLQKYLLALALEPKSMLCLATYKEYEKLIQKNSAYPILLFR